MKRIAEQSFSETKSNFYVHTTLSCIVLIYLLALFGAVMIYYSTDFILEVGNSLSWVVRRQLTESVIRTYIRHKKE